MLAVLVNYAGRILRESDEKAILMLREVIRNSGYSVSVNVVSFGTNFIIAVLLARWLGVSSLGQYAVATAVAGIVFVVVNFGIQVILVREIAKDATKSAEYISHTLAIRIFVSLPVGVGSSYLLARAIGLQDDILILVLAASVFTALSGIVIVLYGVFQAVGKFEYQLRYVLFNKIVSLIGCLVLLVGNFGLVSIVTLFAIIQATTIVFACRKIAQTICPVGLSIDFRLWRNLIRESFPLALAGTAEFVNLKSDAIILGAIKGEWDTGIYNGASNIYLGAIALPSAFMSAFFPVFSRTYNTSREQAVKLFRNVFILMLIGSSILALILAIFSESIILLVYGDEFIPSVLPMIILASGLPFIILNRMCNSALIGMGFQKWLFYVISVSAIFNVVANIILIPEYSFVGASITTVLTEAIVLFVLLWKTYSILRRCSVNS